MLAVMRRSCLANRAIVRQEIAHMDCHSCSRLADLLEAHGRRHSGRVAEDYPDSVVVS